MGEMSEAEREAYEAYRSAEDVKQRLRQALIDPRRARGDLVHDLDRLWQYVSDFVPRQWKDD